MNTSVTIEQLKCFVAVSKELNFRKAAKMLNMSQPPVTRHIINLEYNLKTKLFERNSRSVKLTKDGTLFLTHATDIISRIEDASKIIINGKDRLTGSISLGFIPSMDNDILPLIAKNLKIKLPNIEMMFREYMSFEQVPALNAGNLDIGLSHLPKDLDSFNYSRVVSEEYSLAVNIEHPLSKKNDLTVHDLHDVNFIMYDAIIGKYSFELLSSLFLNSGVKPNFVQYVSQPNVFLGLVKASTGVALLANSAKENCPKNVIFKKIKLPEWVRADVYLVMKKVPKKEIIIEVYDCILEILYTEHKF
ncbi:LysR substrate-binding domain-containing protein [Alphaproteobacteria bacterium]|nr:LysR substrate-binding domain-containing protein [Alphaproteobacteria bacterium]